jgi:hypothetical protein
VSGPVRFELERLTLSDERELEIAGRWRGVRPGRFARPHLTVDGGRRLRATGSGIDGETWWARFQWPEPPPSTAEIEAGNVVVALPPARIAQPAAARPATLPARRTELEPPAPDETGALREQLTESEARARRLASEIDTLHEEFAAAADETNELREQFAAQAQALREQVQELEAERDALREQLAAAEQRAGQAERLAETAEQRAGKAEKRADKAERLAETAKRRADERPVAARPRPQPHHHHPSHTSLPPEPHHPMAGGDRQWIARGVAALLTAGLLFALALTLGMCA